MPLTKRKEKPGNRLNLPSVKSNGLVKKMVKGERNQDEDPGPSNAGPSSRSCSRREVSIVSRSSVPDIEIGPGSGVAQLLEEVLEKIFGLLMFADVKSARLVNKHWRQVATTLLRRSSKLIFLDRSVSECITKMGDGQFPVNRFLIHFEKLNLTEIRSAYFSGICAWVKELTLSVDINKKLSTVRVLDVLATLPIDCVYKDLTHFNLKLIQRTDLCRESWERFADFVRSSLEKSPNLQEVNVEHKSPGAQGPEKLAICPVIENLFPISNSVVTSKLSYINLESVHLERFNLAEWSTLNLKLKKLGLRMSCFSNTNDLLAKFLETQTGTLKDLNLKLSKGNSEQPAMTFTFPKLEKLEQLRVTCNSSYAVVTFAGIDYARLFPCLKKLDLKDDLANCRDFLGNDLLEPINTVEELIFPWNLHDDVENMDLTLSPVVTAAKLFTGLKKLEISADRGLIVAVYESLPNLEVLTFSTCFQPIDNIITGVECRVFKGVMTETWIKRLQNAEGWSMARLQNLKTLKLNNCGWYNDLLRFSRLSFHVFKKMSSLKCLDLFDGCAAAAEERCSADEVQKQFLDELRANFVVL